MGSNFIPYELELALNKLGCKLFINYIVQDEQDPYPTIEKGILWQQAFDWFEKEYKLHVMIETVLMSYGIVDCRNNDIKIIRTINHNDKFVSKLELRTDALNELIKLAKHDTK
jgi:hypothetical protein